MSKETRTVSLDEENDEWLEEQNNASAVVNDLVEQARRNGGTQMAAINLQITQKERELEHRESDVDRLKREVEELRELKRLEQKEEEANLERAADALEGVPLEEDNPAVENWAEKLGMSAAELVEELR